MHIVSSFSYTTKLELVILKLEGSGILKEQIIAVPLDRKKGKVALFDSMHRSDGESMMDLASVLSLVFMLLGIIYGYLLPIGPIFLAFLGMVFGFLLGFIIKLLYLKKRSPLNQEAQVDVFLTIKCGSDQQHIIENILWEHGALGIGVKQEK
ncbi:hypothetical protein [Halobacillus seohaensis]|uniref:Uncharacterized protein n=1 Tax=Halobacillus seohaensis TaxID=447421 RepID=A0ABW2EK39_9BACI